MEVEIDLKLKLAIEIDIDRSKAKASDRDRHRYFYPAMPFAQTLQHMHPNFLSPETQTSSPASPNSTAKGCKLGAEMSTPKQSPPEGSEMPA